MIASITTRDTYNGNAEESSFGVLLVIDAVRWHCPWRGAVALGRIGALWSGRGVRAARLKRVSVMRKPHQINGMPGC
jgi:hypothetical protein